MLDENGKLRNFEARIESTTFCNADCIICVRRKFTRPLQTMCYGHFVSLVDQFQRLGGKAVSLFGLGEPLCDKGLPEKIQYCADLGLETHITTNGALLTTNRARKLLNAGLKNIRFSIHACTPVYYEKVHRGLDWLITWRNFANFLHLNKKLGHPCTVHLSVIPLNHERVEDIRKTWERYVDFMEVWSPHNWGGARHFRTVIPKKNTCGRPFNGPLQVQADGKVIPCCFLTNGEVILGDTYESTLKDILQGGPYQALREAHLTGNLVGYPCENCDQRNVDMGSILLYSSRDPERKTGVTSSCKLPV